MFVILTAAMTFNFAACKDDDDLILERLFLIKNLPYAHDMRPYRFVFNVLIVNQIDAV